MKRVHLTAIVLFTALWAVATHVHAAGVTITQNGNVIVSDDFEGATPGSQPVAEVGTWTDGGGTVGRPLGTVTNDASPGPFQGSQYMSLGLSTAQESICASVNPNIGDKIVLDAMVYVPSATATTSYPWECFMNDSFDYYPVFDFWRNANGLWQSEGGVFAPPSQFAFDKWQHWDVDMTVGATSGTVTIDGSSSTFNASHTDLTGSPDYRIGFLNSDRGLPGNLFLDAPAAGPLLGDMNFDGHVDTKDIAAMVLALTNLNSYLATYGSNGVTAANIGNYADVTGGGTFNNSNLQALENYLIAGHGSASAVPEPSGLVLAFTGIVMLGLSKMRCGKQNAEST